MILSFGFVHAVNKKIIFLFFKIFSVTVLCCLSETVCNVLLLSWPGHSGKGDFFLISKAFPG